MTSLVYGLLLLVSPSLAWVLLKNQPRLLCGVALATNAVPFLLPLSMPFGLAGAAVFFSFFQIRTLHSEAGNDRPRQGRDFLFFTFTYFNVVRWETPHRPDR